MSKYIWINPVAEKMYGNSVNEIKGGLENKGYILAECEPQLEYIKNQYKEHAEKISDVILDCRCPESINLIRRENLLDNFEVPYIEPILVRTSRVLYKKYVKTSDDILIITCPCTQLRDYTRQRLQDKSNVRVYTWKEFIESEGMHSLGKTEESPIPLGFFKGTFENILEISGEEKILKEIKNIKKTNEKKYDIVEMLYCEGGCNNGDGL